MSDDKKNGNGNGNGSGHRVIQFTPPPPVQQQPGQPPYPQVPGQPQPQPQLMGGASVIAKLRSLLAMAETGQFHYMVFVGLAPNGNITVSWSNTNEVKDKVYLLGAIDLAKETMVKELTQTAKKGSSG